MGSNVRALGYAMKARPGPDSATSAMLMFCQINENVPLRDKLDFLFCKLKFSGVDTVNLEESLSYLGSIILKHEP